MLTVDRIPAGAVQKYRTFDHELKLISCCIYVFRCLHWWPYQEGLMLRYGLEWPVITSEIGNWSVCVFVGTAFCIRDNHEMRRTRVPHLQMPSRLWE